MGGCHANSRSLSKVQNPSAKVVPSANNLSWLDNSEASTLHDEQLDVKSLSLNLSMITFFGRFYKKKIGELKNTESFLFDAAQRSLFIEQLAIQNNVTQATADVWVYAYIDYMIVMAWLNFAVQEKEMYAPFAIQQTQRLHISFSLEYSKFCNILTGNKGLIHYSPNKLVSTNQSLEMMENSYDELRETMNSYVYENPEIFSEVFNDIFKTSTKTKYQLQEIWETFYETFIKNEFSFYISKAQGPQVLRAISNICSENHNFPLTYEGVELLRATLNLSIDYKGDSSMNVFSLLSESASEKEKNIARSLDEGKLPLNFARHVSWEQVIPIEKARERIVEYKKFILNVLNGQEINELPNEEIKQIWFLHMSFTKNYQKFIQEIIKKNDLQEVSDKQKKSLFEKIEASQNVKGAGSFVEFMQPIMKRQEELVNQKIQSLYSI